MSADTVIYLQKRLSGRWVAWQDFASNDNPYPGTYNTVADEATREAALLKAFDWNEEQVYPMEYGIRELPDETTPEIEERALYERLKAKYGNGGGK